MSMYAGTNYVPKIFIGNKKVNEMYVGNDKKFHFVDTLKRTNEASGNVIIRQNFAITDIDKYRNSFWSDGTVLYQQVCAGSSTFLMFDTIAKKWVYKDFYGYTSFMNSRMDSNCIWTNGDNIYYSRGTENYVLDKTTSTWNVKTWAGLTDFYGNDIWTDGDNIYYSSGSENYILDRATSTWSKKTWKGLTDFYGTYIWTDGDNIYYSQGSDHYILDKTTNTWSVKTWNISINGQCIWTDGDNVYYSDGSSQYVLDKSTDTWNVKGWNEKIYGKSVWSDGNDLYHTSTDGQTLLYNKQDTSWSLITMIADTPRDIAVDSRNFWSDGNSLYYTGENKTYIVQDMNIWIKKDAWDSVISQGRYVWTDGEDVYYSTGSSSGQLILDKINDVWSKKTWNGSNYFYGEDVWSDGKNTYCFMRDLGILNYKTCVLDKANNTWNVKVWKGLDAFRPDPGATLYMWCDGDNTYYSYRTAQYIFNKNTNLWERKIWSGSFYPAYGCYVWFDGDDIYYSDKDDYQWQLKYNRNNDAWEKIYWKNNRVCNGAYVWSDGNNTYYSNGDTQWILSKTQQYTWNDISPWYCQGSPLEYGRFDYSLSRDYTWTDGSNIYYTYNKNSSTVHYMWDDITLTWTQKTIPFSGFAGYNVWTDGDNVYYSMVNNKHYVLNKTTGSWSVKTWNGLTSFYGSDIWTDGENVYYSQGSQHYVLDKTTNTWNVKTWAGLTSFDGTYIWTDGDDIYYSYFGGAHYILDRATNTWNAKTWDLGSLSSVNGHDVLNVNGTIICAYNNYGYGSGLYKFNKNTKQWENFTWYRYDDSGNLVNFNIAWGQCVWNTGSTLRYDYSPKQHFQLYVENDVYIWKPLTSFISIKLSGNRIWSDDENTYGISTDNSETTEMILDKQSNLWLYMNSKEINSRYIWHDYNYNLYYSADSGKSQRAFNKVTHTWDITEWNIPVYDVWYNGTDIYCWYNSKAYMLNPNTNMWEYVSMYGVIDDISALYIWNDNGKLYSIAGSKRYMYNDSNDIWEPIDTWSGYNDFYGSYIWSDGDNLYCTGQVPNGSLVITRQYVFDSTLKRWNKKTWLGDYSGFITKPYIYNNTLYVSNLRKNYTFST